MSALAYGWPVAFTLALLGVRSWELRRKFEAVPGRILAPNSFRELVSVGTGSVILCVCEYLWRGQPPRSLALSLLGAALGAATFVLRGQARKALADMWSVHVEIREAHTLVQTGPYARIRHPIYLGAVLEVTATALVLNAWIAGPVCVAATVFVLLRRIRAEEVAMEEKFGDAWRVYCRKAGPLWPKL
jgi:protein-S-isoprenylcysteine O-methyltransferase Ste14